MKATKGASLCLTLGRGPFAVVYPAEESVALVNLGRIAMGILASPTLATVVCDAWPVANWHL